MWPYKNIELLSFNSGLFKWTRSRSILKVSRCLSTLYDSCTTCIDSETENTSSIWVTHLHLGKKYYKIPDTKKFLLPQPNFQSFHHYFWQGESHKIVCANVQAHDKNFQNNIKDSIFCFAFFTCVKGKEIKWSNTF